MKVKRAAKGKKLEKILSGGMSRLRNHEADDDNYAHFVAGTWGRCPFQTGEGLCLLQLECGAECLPEVCREYPRKSLYTSAAKELSLSPSCEGVLALLWDLPQGIDFWEEPLPKQDWRVLNVPARFVRFADIRSFCIDVLQERSLPISRRMLMLGVLLRRLRGMDWAAEGAVDQWLAWGEEYLRSPDGASALEEFPRDRLKFLRCNFRVLTELYECVNKEEFYHALFDALSVDGEGWEEKGLGNFFMDTGRYQELENRLLELLGHTDEFFENLMVLMAFYKTFPNPEGPGELWKSYAAICGVYSFCWFAAVLGCHKEVSRERLFQIIAIVSRDFLHNPRMLDRLLDIVLEDGGTLDKISILLGG